MPDWLASGFSFAGLSVVVLQQIPGIVRAVHPPAVDPFADNSGPVLVEIAEKTFGIATLALVVVVFAPVPVPSAVSVAFLACAYSVLAAYYAFYVLYYRGTRTLWVLLGMAAFPPLAFFLVALSQGNYLAASTSVIFGAVHVGLTRSNLVKGRLRGAGQRA